MPGVDNIKKRILEDAQTQAKITIDKAQNDAAIIIEAAIKDANEKKELMIEKANSEALQVQKRLKAVAELESRKKRLKAKQDIVEEAFSKAVERLNNMGDIEYQSIISEMILNSVESGKEEIVLSSRDQKRLSPDFINDLNKKLSSKGISGEVKLSSESRNIKGGFILKQGDIEINNSFDAIIRMKRDQIESEVISSLF